ncbi:heavy metal-responsive transcriptional regulator [Modestobacter marinus]|uniref:DNA-binding transcriptional MerR regulator n=1 Tax=Modestobacter marinus TaxID=477641 RepID=A0A846M0X6_9ACTN|nr:heavy metal-responsive transcriptional regulator [Modestobacter marinus]NIH69319.1 DNA-binding transcriptional MerR regulator [Modestobacter marinus]
MQSKKTVGADRKASPAVEGQAQYGRLVRIGELAAKAGLTAKAIRFYEHAGVLPEPERQPSGYRDYDDSALARLRFVKAAQAAGLTLAEIRQVIAVRDLSGPPCRHVTDLLDTHAADLDRRIAELSALREEVRRLRDRANGLDPDHCDDMAVCHVIPAELPAAGLEPG